MPVHQSKVSVFQTMLPNQRIKRAGPTAADDEELIIMPPVTTTKSKGGLGQGNISATPHPGSRPYNREDFGEQYG